MLGFGYATNGRSPGRVAKDYLDALLAGDTGRADDLHRDCAGSQSGSKSETRTLVQETIATADARGAARVVAALDRVATEVGNLARRGDKIPAIKVLRDATGCGLGEAKRIVEGMGAIPPQPSTPFNHAALLESVAAMARGDRQGAESYYQRATNANASDASAMVGRFTELTGCGKPATPAPPPGEPGALATVLATVTGLPTLAALRVLEFASRTLMDNALTAELSDGSRSQASAARLAALITSGRVPLVNGKDK